MMWKVMLAAVLVSGVALADGRQCLIEVEGVKYLDDRCDIEEHDGTVWVGVRPTRAKYFAVVETHGKNASPIGWGNGAKAEGSLTTMLGQMTKSGECWQNDRARIVSAPP